jgi:outer membrane receptor protein involved in Fe transport
LNILSQIQDVGDVGTRYNQNSESLAVFTHNIISVTDTVDLTLGLRYTREDKTLDVDFQNSNSFCPQVRAIPGVSPGIVTLACLGFVDKGYPEFD